MNLAKNLALV